MYETLAVINCFFFDFPEAKDCFVIFKSQLIDSTMSLLKLSNPGYSALVVNRTKLMCLRIIRNLLVSRIITGEDLKD